MKKAKIKDGVDYISALPDPILQLILSRLHSTIDVVRTSVLSTRWKYLWTSVPSLHVNVYRKPTNWFKRDELTEFVYWVLLNRTLDLDSFTLDCSGYYYEMSTIRRWIHAVVMRKVKRIDMTFSLMNEYEAIVLPRCLVDCGSLEMLTLKLSLHCLSLKSFTGSKTLKVLRLESVDLLDHDLVQSFLVNCPLLEELSLINCLTHKLDYFIISCPNLKTLRIDKREVNYSGSAGRNKQYADKKLCERLTVICPKLVYFEYGGHMANHFSFDVKSLKKAVIELEDPRLTAKRDDNFCVTICELFAQVSHVEYLSINRLFLRSILKSCDRSKEGFPESLPNLKKLELKFDCELMVVLCILKCSFNLESLHLIIPKNISSYEVKRFIEELKGVETRRTLTRQLKRVEFSDFRGEKEKLAIARFLLEHGNALEEIVFSLSKRSKYRKQSMEAMIEVSNFYKASSSVKVIILNG